MPDPLEQPQPSIDEGKHARAPVVHEYVSKPNELGVDGYNLVANPALVERFPMPTSQRLFFETFCKQRGIAPDKIPLSVSLPKHDDMRSLVTAAVVMVFETYGYNLKDTKGLSLVSPKGLIITTLENGTQRTLIEHYDEDNNVISITNRLFYDDEIKRQLKDRYNIPVNASEDYLVVYLTAHSAVHHMQNLQKRMEKHPEGFKDNPETVVKEQLELQTEKEAHNVGVKIADEIWQKTVAVKG